jgi:SAM-dependent methyltransferase
MRRKIMTLLQNKCPYCSSYEAVTWADEKGFSVVRCKDCRILFLSPKPSLSEVNEAVRTGLYEEYGLNVRSRRVQKKIKKYKKLFCSLFGDLILSSEPITWVDVGCGYGEILEALGGVAPPGSLICGYEPMKFKAERSVARGLRVTNDYLAPYSISADVISVVDIFSHIPDFHSFLKTLVTNLKNEGLLFLETGNLADLDKRDEFPGDLGLPDHLVFAGESTIKGYLEQANFEIEAIKFVRVDTMLDFIKRIIKRLLGQSVLLNPPYSSKYRQILIRARLRSSSRSYEMRT